MVRKENAEMGRGVNDIFSVGVFNRRKVPHADRAGEYLQVALAQHAGLLERIPCGHYNQKPVFSPLPVRYNLIMTPKLTHLNESGSIRMVDVGNKTDTERHAVASGEVVMKRETLDLIRAGKMKKGDVLMVAQIAGITAAKRTSELIPLCHPLPITHIDVILSLDDVLPGVVITASVKTTGKTGVEMEALTAVSVAGLTIYDMAKAAEKTMKIQNIRLVEKHGGRSGDVENK